MESEREISAERQVLISRIVAGLTIAGALVSVASRFPVGRTVEFDPLELLFSLALLVALPIASAALSLKRLWTAAPWLLLPPLALALLGTVAAVLADRILVADIPFPWLLLLYTILIAASFALSLVLFVKRPRRVTPIPPLESTGIAVTDSYGNVREGWYPDPDGKPAERFFDGQEWTDRSRPMTASSAALITRGRIKPTFTSFGEPISPKSRAAAAILCWFLGIIGVHRFYVGKVGTGIAQIFTLGGLGIWVIIDFIWILTGTWKDKQERVIANW